MRALIVVVIAACGRVGFDAIDASGARDGGDDAVAVTCPTSCIGATNNGASYCYCSTSRTRGVAASTCATTAMQLIRIDDAAENEWARSFPEANGLASSEPLWIGGNDIATEGAWEWVDGTAFWTGDGNGVAVGGLYNAWDIGSGQPNNNSGSEDCAAIETSRLWNDTDCPMQHPFVCE